MIDVTATAYEHDGEIWIVIAHEHAEHWLRPAKAMILADETEGTELADVIRQLCRRYAN